MAYKEVVVQATYETVPWPRSRRRARMSLLTLLTATITVITDEIDHLSIYFIACALSFLLLLSAGDEFSIGKINTYVKRNNVVQGKNSFYSLCISTLLSMIYLSYYCLHTITTDGNRYQIVISSIVSLHYIAGSNHFNSFLSFI